MAGGAIAAQAAAPLAGRQAPGLYRYRVGDFELTAINDGVWHRPIDAAFVRNAAYADIQQAMADAFMPAGDTLALPLTMVLVNTGAKLILIDTGTGGQIGPSAGALLANLAAAGVMPEAIDAVVISHFHFDHIDGLKTKDDARVFPNAEILVPAPEWRFWMDDANLRAAPDSRKREFLNARRIVHGLDRELRQFNPGDEVLSGVTSLPAFGHTPGHTVFAVTSGNAAVLVLGDTTDHPALFVRHPEWQPSNDMDGPQAAETRAKLLDRVAADRMLVQGYHFPFPGLGRIMRHGAGFDFVPAQWQSQL